MFLKLVEEICVDSDSTVTILEVEHWLEKNKNTFYESIGTSQCGKWSKWVRDKNIHLFPCCCSIREDDCIFIESYFKLLRVLKFTKDDITYKKAMLHYERIKHNPKAIFEWIKDNEGIGIGLSLIEPIIKIYTISNPYTTMDIYLDTEENPELWEFKEKFNTNYYSKDYENY